MESSASSAERVGTAIGVALAAGTAIAAVGFKEAITLGMEFQSTLNELQSVSQATDAQMSAISATAQRLGSDLTLPATSAKDAAEVMLELAKGGLTVEQAMAAASGTIMLAAAAQISGAEAAQIQSAALNTFGLEAGDAGRVADVLANSANAASGEITDFAQAMQQVGAVANQFGISIEDTSTALSLFANAGIRGSDAGTLLKSALIGLANPSKPAQKAMEQLSLTAFDAQGNFVGLESVFAQLREASTRLTPEMYNQAAATVFGSDAVRLAGVAAGTSAEQWDAMSAAVSRSGGAQEVAAAKTKGLAGAIDQMNSQIETAQLQVFDAIAEPLEQGVRAATGLIPALGDSISSGLRVIVATGRTVGPGLGAAISSGAGAVVAAGRSLVDPFINSIGTALVGAFEVGASIASSYVGVLDNVVTGLTPVAQGLGQVADAAVSSDGALAAVGATLTVVGDAVELVSGVLVPVGAVVGGLVSAFAALPGPIQTVALAMLALRFAGPLIAGLGSAFNGITQNTGVFGRALAGLTSPIRAFGAGVNQAVQTSRNLGGEVSAASTRANEAVGSFGRLNAGVAGLGRGLAGAVTGARQFGGEMRLQTQLAQGFGYNLSRLQAAQMAYQTSTLGAVAATRGFTNQVAAIRAGALAGGQSVSAFAATMTALGQRVPTIAAMSAAFTTAAAGATRFAGAAGVAAAAAVGLRSIGAGLIGALGGPFGVAITTAVVGLGLWASANARAKQEAQQHEATIDSLAGSLAESGGQFNQNAREVLAGTDTYKAAADSVKQFGVDLGDLTDIAINQGAPLEDLRAKLTAIVDANKQFATDEFGNQNFTGLTDLGREAQAALTNLDALVGVVNDSRASYADFAQAVDEAGGSLVNGAAAGSTLQGALQVLGDAAADADAKTRALNDALNALSGGQLSLEQSQARLNESLSGIGASFEAAKAAADGAGVGFLNATGGINTTTEAGSALLDEVAELGQNMTDTAQKAFDAAGGFGNLSGATVAAREAAQSSYDAFIQAAQSIGLTAEQAAGLAARYGLIPDTVVTLLTAQGLDQVDQELLQLKARFDAVPGQKTITVQSLTEDARARLEELGFSITTLPDGQVQITANTDAALSQLGAAMSLVNGATGTITIDANNQPADGRTTASLALMNGSTGTMTLDANGAPAEAVISGTKYRIDTTTGIMTIDGNPAPGQADLSGFKATVDRTTGTVRVDANTAAARSQVNSFIASFQGRTIDLRVSTAGRLAQGGIVTAMDDGGVVGRAVGFAAGGTAQRKLRPMRAGLAAIVPPNTWRVVGDRLVDDEAYIPINKSRRSMALLEETARRMGRYLQPVRGYADGGIADAAARSLASLRIDRGTPTTGADTAALLAEVRALRLTDGDVEVIHGLKAQTRALLQGMQAAGRIPTHSTAREMRERGEFGGFA